MLPSTSLIPIHDANPTRTFSWVTAGLIAANVLVFLTEPGLGRASAQNPASLGFFCHFGIVPRELTNSPPSAPLLCSGEPGGGYVTLFSSMFLHSGWAHLLGNMLFLWVFGNNVEDVLGRARYVAFYLLTGLAASFAHILANPTSDIPTVGASGAIAGILGAYLVLFPRARIKTIVPLFLFWLVDLPAAAVLGYWFLSQFLIGAGQQLGAGVAWMAHVGGFTSGALLMLLLRRGDLGAGGRAGPWGAPP
jgi:membrane associated rhomboid family serine protease